MASITLDSFKNSFDDFLRSNRFLFSIEEESWSEGLNWQEDFEYMCKTSSIPSRTVGETILHWQGLKYNVPTDPSFDAFTVTFLNDTNYKLKNYFEDWVERIAQVQSNNRNSHESLKATLVVSQLNATGEITKVYRLIYAHPTSVGEIELDYDSNDQIQTFQVTFSYSYFIIENQEEVSEPERAVTLTQNPTKYSIRDGTTPQKSAYEPSQYSLREQGVSQKKPAYSLL